MHLHRFFVQAQDTLTSLWKTRIREIKSKKNDANFSRISLNHKL